MTVRPVLAHIGGLPLEETLASLAPSLAAFAAALKSITRHRRREDPRGHQPPHA